MDKKAFQDKITEIGTCEDDVRRRELLAELSDEGAADYDRMAELTAQNEAHTKDNEALREANMKLFLRIGSKSREEGVKDEYGAEPPKEKLKFEDLFNEKGGLK